MSNQKTSPGCSMASDIAFASIVVRVGAFVVPILFNVIPANPDSFHTSQRVAAYAGMVFLPGGD